MKGGAAGSQAAMLEPPKELYALRGAIPRIARRYELYDVTNFPLVKRGGKFYALTSEGSMDLQEALERGELPPSFEDAEGFAFTNLGLHSYCTELSSCSVSAKFFVVPTGEFEEFAKDSKLVGSEPTATIPLKLYTKELDGMEVTFTFLLHGSFALVIFVDITFSVRVRINGVRLKARKPSVETLVNEGLKSTRIETQRALLGW